MDKILISNINRINGVMGLNEITYRELQALGNDGRVGSSISEIALKWLNKGFGNLIKVVIEDKTYYVDENKFPLLLYFHDNETIMFVNYEKIWVFFESIFGLKDLQTQEILKVWLEQTYNLRDFGVTYMADLMMKMLDDLPPLKPL
jgi:hypothetical protein